MVQEIPKRRHRAVVGGVVVVSGSTTEIWMNSVADAPSGSVTV